MFTLKIETSDKSLVELTQNETKYQVVSITGLNPPQAQINTSSIAGMDGGLFNSAKLQTRNIVITIRINGDVERNRLNLYKYFRTKDYCKIYYKNGSRDVFIEGYVENVDCDYFTKSELAQISIICPNPYFKDLEIMTDDISKVIQMFKFPFTINMNAPIPFSKIETNKVTDIVNTSESETGLIIYASFYGNVRNFEIRNTGTGENMRIIYPFIDGDVLTVDCNKGNKSIILTRDARKINLVPYLRKGSTFLQLNSGDNHFSYLADEGLSDQLVSIQFEHYNIYRGV